MAEIVVVGSLDLDGAVMVERPSEPGQPVTGIGLEEAVRRPTREEVSSQT
jgi:hypothetical protein